MDKSVATSLGNSSKTVICLYEDRKDCMLGAKLLIRSAQAHEPEWQFHTFLRCATEGDISWFGNQPNVVIRDDLPDNVSGWNVKPTLLKRLLNELPVDSDVIWCDSDIVLAGSISHLLNEHPKRTLIATEVHGWGRDNDSKLRTRGWNLSEGRALKRTVNSCFVRFNTAHAELLDDWEALLMRQDYVEAQAAPWNQRPKYFMGDQDALTALLASEKYQFLELYLLRSGTDIAQCFQEDGYSIPARVKNFFSGRMPPLIHAQGAKPWRSGKRQPYEELAPYVFVAGPYARAAGFEEDWLKASTYTAKLLAVVFFRDPNISGLIPAVVKFLRRVKDRLAHR